MKTILLLGVGRSTHTLIKYLVKYATTLNIKIILADKISNDFIKPYIKTGQCNFISFDIHDAPLRKKHISNADIVISMLQPKFHILVAKECILLKKNLITASYVSDEIRALD